MAQSCLRNDPDALLQSLALHARYACIHLLDFERDPENSDATEQSGGISFARTAEIFAGHLV
jgi:hypothetical protein